MTFARLRIRVSLATLALAGPLACHAPAVLVTSEDAGGDAAEVSDPAAAMHEAARAVAEKECAGSEHCQPSVFASNWGDLATCIASQTALREKRAFGVGSLPEHVTQREACAAATDPSDCGSWAGLAIDGTCYLAGTLPDGASCSWSSQCKGALCSGRVSTVLDCGTCLTRQPEGGSCYDSSDCLPGFACPSTGTGARCTRWRELGEACGADAPCHGYLACRAGRCEAWPAIDAPCTPNPAETPCGAQWRGVFCSTTTRVCEAGPVHPIGQPCGMGDDGVVSYCVRGAACKLVTDTKGICVAAVADGQPCGGAYLFSSAACMAPSTCNGRFDATCGLRDAAYCAPPAVPP